jgi:regulator of protease activity HflC (stomatin/prohibitin superfamily)
MKKHTFLKLIVAVFAAIAWFGFIGPWAVSAESSVLSFGWLGLTVVAGLWFIAKGIRKGRTPALAMAMVAATMGGGLTACSKVPAGNVGVKVYLLGGAKGVESEVLGTGRYWIGFNEELYLFPLFQQNHTWDKDKDLDESFSFQTKEGMVVNTDVGITYHINKPSVSALFQKYRKPVDEIRDQFVKNHVRDALSSYGSKMSIEETYGTGKTALFDSVQNRVSRALSPDGIVVDKVYLVGQFRLPQAVINALNAKIAATQQAQQRENEVATARAQAEIAIAEARGKSEAALINARAEAEALQLKARQLTPIMVEYEKAQRWNGILPTHQLGGNTFLNVK